MIFRPLRLLTVALLLLSASGCNLLYRMDIQQGNVITQEMIDKLKPGMTPSQVRFVLGTPLIADPFHPQRWDYYYSYRDGAKGEAEQRRLTVIFEGDRLLRLEGDVVSPPAGNGTAASPPPTAPVQAPPATETTRLNLSPAPHTL